MYFRTMKKYKLVKMFGSSQFKNKIAEGTHGIIYTLQNDDLNIVKMFKNDIKKQPSMCRKFDVSHTICERINYEYLIQQYVFENLKNTDLKIKIPFPSDFNNDEKSCYYKMEYIHPADNEENLVLLDMGKTNFTKYYKGVGEFKSYDKINLKLFDLSDETELSYELGKLFSFLHFKLNIDGYDCECVFGKIQNNNCICFIDFDKVSCFEFQLNFEVSRKLDENTFDTKIFKSFEKIALFLFSAMISMSLIPTNNYLKEYFLKGYSCYVNFSNETEKQTYEILCEIILKYE